MACSALLLCFLALSLSFHGLRGESLHSKEPRRLLLDTDMDMDDIFALLYLLKQNRSEFDLKAVTINANSWSDAGHAVNHLYDILYMMGRDDINVGVGGEGGISKDSKIHPDVGGYLPLIDQDLSTVGDCRYRQAIPVSGRLNVDTNFGLRRSFLPQGSRRYIPLVQPTAQQVMIDAISDGPTTVILIGALTNFAIFLMTHPELKKNVEHVYVMGGAIRSKNPYGCCTKSSTSCEPSGQCGMVGNLYTGYMSNPYAEFNIFLDPFSAYQVFHSGIPITLVPLDATNTIPITEQFLDEFKRHQNTFEAQYCYQALKFYPDSFMWDPFASGIAISIIRNGNKYDGQNEFAEMEFMNLTVITSNRPYDANDGSNPFFDGQVVPKFNLTEHCVHSGHVQTRVDDPFCLINGSNRGKCEDGYTKEATGPEAVRVRVATKAKTNQDDKSSLDREFLINFLQVLNLPQQTGRFNLTTEFPYYREIFCYQPKFSDKTKGKPVIFDMDMSAGDFLSLIYLLKAPTELINLKGILVSGNGWANTATIDIIYDVLHMMGRDDIMVGLGSSNALGTPILSCKYVKAIPKGSGGLLDSDTLFGLGRTLPRSPRRYATESSTEFRQQSAFEVWQSATRKLAPNEKIIILANGPLTNIANIILSDNTTSSVIENIYIVGGNIKDELNEEGNVFTVPSNRYAEFNFFLDPLAAKVVIESDINITLIPLNIQRKLSSFRLMIEALELSKETPEAHFSYHLLSLMQRLKQKHKAYHHMDMFLGEILGAFFLVEGANLSHVVLKKIKVLSNNNISENGEVIIDNDHGKVVKIISDTSEEEYYTNFAIALSSERQSAVIGSFDEQKKLWSNPSEALIEFTENS